MDTSLTEKQVQEINKQVLKKKASLKIQRLGENVQPIAKSASRLTTGPEWTCEKCGLPQGGRDIGVCGVCTGKRNGLRASALQRKKQITQVIPKLYRKARMHNLTKGLQEAARSLPEWKGIYLWGEAGRGKTFAMAAIARMLMWRGETARRVSYEMLCSEIRDTYKSKDDRSEKKVIKKYLTPDKVFIEDVGTTKSIGSKESDFSRRVLLIILNERLEQCRATFITSNLSVEDLENSFDSRIASRIQQACEVVKLTGIDRRVK